MHQRVIFASFLMLFAAVGVVRAQEPVPTPTEFAGKWAWKPILTHEGVTFSYIFYSEADSENNGVVLMLQNVNTHAVDYAFKVLLRSEDDELFVDEVTGNLKAQEAKTGSKDGLFWIPFTDGRSVAAVGLRGYKITKRSPDAENG